MSNEAVQVVRTEDPVDWIVLDADAYEKGTVMLISGSSTIGRTAKSGSVLGTPFAGILRREKKAGDGRTRVALFRDGIFRMKSAGSPITAGAAVEISGSNTIAQIVTADSDITGNKIGTALEDFASGETKEVWVGR